MTRSAGFDEPRTPHNPLPGQDGQTPSESEALRQDALELFEKVGAGENAPLRPFGGGDHFFGRLTEKGLGDVNIGVEKDLHLPWRRWWMAWSIAA
jgi:hypothetical protein